VPSESAEARSDRDKEVEAFIQRPVDPALLTASRSGGPPARRGRPGKQGTSKKVRFMSLILYHRSKHNTCVAGVQSSSSSAAGAGS
jgi:hypothetical protein